MILVSIIVILFIVFMIICSIKTLTNSFRADKYEVEFYNRHKGQFINRFSSSLNDDID